MASVMLSGLNKSLSRMFLIWARIINYWPWGGKMQHTGSSCLARPCLMSGHHTLCPHPHPAQWSRCRLLTECSVRVLSAVSTLISALDHGWHFSFLSSASLFALSLERVLLREEMFQGGSDSCLGDLCARAAEEVPPARPFFKNRTCCALQGKPGRQPCRRKVSELCFVCTS